MKDAAIVFDVNGTLLDLQALDPGFARVFGTAEARQQWFGILQQLFLTVAVTGRYVPFTELAAAALQKLAAARRIVLAAEQRDGLLAGMRNLPAYTDAAGALKQLREAGLRLVALTNSGASSARENLHKAGLDASFEAILSTDQVRRYKPAPAPYRMAAEFLHLSADKLWLVAAHDWDIAGARSVGYAGAFVCRPGEVWAGLQPGPSLTAPSLQAAAEAILSRLNGSAVR